MNYKIIKPTTHVLLDYGFIAAQTLVPSLLGVNKKATRLYQILGANLFVYNALTDKNLSPEPIISYRTHGRIDVGNVIGITLLGLYKNIRKDKRALGFHLAFVGLAALNVLLTNWNADPDK